MNKDHLTFADLKAFYRTNCGIMVRRRLRHEIRNLASHWQEKRLCGIGYALPFLPKKSKVTLLSPKDFGPPPNDSRLSLYTPDKRSILEDESVDILLAIHTPELLDNPENLLREFWRMLSHEGELILIVPNTFSAWSKSIKTPFARDKAFHHSELSQLCTAQNFTICHHRHNFVLPPSMIGLGLTINRLTDKLLYPLTNMVGGIQILHAKKRVGSMVVDPVPNQITTVLQQA